MLSFLPAQLGPLLKFLIAGAGSDADELRRFFDLHVVVLPGVLVALLAVKMYMFEVHGSSEPASGVKGPVREVPWFPHLFLYLTMIGSVLVAVLLAASSLFPISLAPEFNPKSAASFVPQPEWYFLSLYQVLKFSVFEGPGIQLALGGATAFVILLILLPFLDRGHVRNPASRPIFVTAGIIAIAEVVALTAWGYLTPGKAISNQEALTVTGGIAAVIAILSWITFRARRTFYARYASDDSKVNVPGARNLPPPKELRGKEA
jgi:quinol-cytochrome oxidoreductase complex cytochrome b subunit